MGQAWGRLPEEGVKQYEAFCVYRDLGPSRSIRLLVEKTGKPKALLERWSVKYRWQERLRAWADYQDQVKREAAVAVLVEMSDRHARIAAGFLAKLEDRLESVDLAKMTPASMAAWLDTAVKVERNARGLGTDGSALVLPAPGAQDGLEGVSNGGDIQLAIEGLKGQLQRLSVALRDYSGDTDGYTRLLNVYGQTAERLGILLRVQRVISGQSADGIAGAVATALDEISAELGIKL